MTTTIWPWLPVEIIEVIIYKAWSLPLSAKDRETFIVSSTIVNKTWAAAFVKISLKDVHIPSAHYAQQYLRILRNESPVYAEYSQLLPDLLCSSLSFTLDTRSSPIGKKSMFIRPFGDYEDLGVILSNTLYAIDTLSYLPNLRRVSIEYTNWGMNDLFDNFRLSSFPTQVSTLEIKFKATSGKSDMIKQYHVHTGRVPWLLPSITHLFIGGAREGFLADIVAACPNLQTLDIESTPRLNLLEWLPYTVHTVILRIASNVTRRGYIKALVGALMAGWPSSPPLQKPQIILEWGEIEKSTWMWLQEIAQNRGVQLAHHLDKNTLC
jgi:hypothetical protein